MTAVDELGYVAASLVLATFSAKSMVLLRALAIASNLAFIAYGYCAGLWPILALHTVMLPLNLMRLCEALGIVSSRPDPSANIGYAAIAAAWRLLLPAQRIFSRLRLRAQFSKTDALASRISVQTRSLVGSPPLGGRKEGLMRAVVGFESGPFAADD